MNISPVIVCPDCGGRAHILQIPGPDDHIDAGDVVAYRCEDCLDRWDVVVSDEDIADDDRSADLSGPGT